MVVVSFGVMNGAKKWKDDVNCPFDILLDPDRAVCCTSFQLSLFNGNKNWFPIAGFKELVFVH